MISLEILHDCLKRIERSTKDLECGPQKQIEWKNELGGVM
jgi:hypothetical protein